MQEIHDTLFRNAPSAVLVLGREGHVVSMNGEARRTLAMEPERVVGRPILATVAPADRDRVKALFLRVLRGQTREWTARFKRGDGVTRVQWVRAVPLPRDGGVGGILLFARDITESRAGRPETVQLQTLLENLPGQFVAVLDGTGRIRYSSGLSRTHYLADVTTVGSPFEDLLLSSEHNADLLAAMLEAVAGGEHWAGTQWHRRVDGTTFPARTFASPYVDPRHGRILGVLVSGRDAGTEEDWRARAHANRRLAGIGEAVAEIASRFESGLTEVAEGLERLGEGRDGTDVGSIAAAVALLQTYARSLGSFSGDVSLRPEAVSLTESAARALERFRPWIASLGVQLDVESVDDLPAVEADPDHVVGALEALVENALEALAPVEPRRLRVGFAHEGGVVHVVIADSGVGIDPEDVHRIFAPLHSTKPGRAGLGLTRVKGIAEALGGRVHIESDPEGWTVATLELPVEAPGSRMRFRPAPLQLTRTRTVLVVDDEERVRSGVRRFLEKVGFEVREAWSGRSALAQITVSRPPELVVTDLRMADGSGYWFLEQLSRDFPELLRRTVIITGDASGDEEAAVVERTGCPAITKPVEMPHLLELLDEIALRN